MKHVNGERINIGRFLTHFYLKRIIQKNYKKGVNYRGYSVQPGQTEKKLENSVFTKVKNSIS